MTSQSKKLLDQALTLSESDRAYIATSLIDSLDGAMDSDVDQVWGREFERRLNQLNSGTAGVSWVEARKKILESIK